jgi:hypothetical protein
MPPYSSAIGRPNRPIAPIFHDLVGKLAAFVDLADDRGDPLAGEVFYGGAPRRVLLGQC